MLLRSTPFSLKMQFLWQEVALGLGVILKKLSWSCADRAQPSLFKSIGINTFRLWVDFVREGFLS